MRWLVFLCSAVIASSHFYSNNVGLFELYDIDENTEDATIHNQDPKCAIVIDVSKKLKVPKVKAEHQGNGLLALPMKQAASKFHSMLKEVEISLPALAAFTEDELTSNLIQEYVDAGRMALLYLVKVLDNKLYESATVIPALRLLHFLLLDDLHFRPLRACLLASYTDHARSSTALIDTPLGELVVNRPLDERVHATDLPHAAREDSLIASLIPPGGYDWRSETISHELYDRLLELELSHSIPHQIIEAVWWSMISWFRGNANYPQLQIPEVESLIGLDFKRLPSPPIGQEKPSEVLPLLSLEEFIRLPPQLGIFTDLPYRSDMAEVAGDHLHDLNNELSPTQRQALSRLVKLQS